VDHVYANVAGNCRGGGDGAGQRSHRGRGAEGGAAGGNRRARGRALEETIAVGDGANDLPMLRLAGMGVAFHAKPVVRAEARFRDDKGGLDGFAVFAGGGGLGVGVKSRTEGRGQAKMLSFTRSDSIKRGVTLWRAVNDSRLGG